MKKLWIGIALVVIAQRGDILNQSFAQSQEYKPSQAAVEFFESRIRPVLVQHCYECHSAASPELKGELRLDFRNGLLKGGESGAAIVAGNPEQGTLLAALRHESFEMPPSGKLPDNIIADFETWIRNGAADPRRVAKSAADVAADAWKTQLKKRSRWWSLQPVGEPAVPEVNHKNWSRDPIDSFIFCSLATAGLTPAKPAENQVLLRRLSIILTGMPFMWRPVDDRLKDERTGIEIERGFHVSEVQYTAIVDQLLDSPQFGERFARHWMDVVRYTDTYGYEWDVPAKGSWEYRDYLIRAFNSDVPFDQLIREQLAGDLLADPRINKAEQLNESLIGPMFYHMGEHRHGSSLDFNGIHQEMINNKIDAFSKAFLGMTIACARCHDHKLDAVSQADYYALAGVFMSPRWTPRVIDTPVKFASEIEKLTHLRSEIQQHLAGLWQAEAKDLNTKLPRWVEAQSSMPGCSTNLKKILTIVSQATDETIATKWHKTAEEWQSENLKSRTANRQKFKTLADFSTPDLPANWTSEGAGIQHGWVKNGTPLIALEGDQVIEQLLPQGYHTHALSSKLPGIIRLPAQHEIDGKIVSLQLNGDNWAGWLIAPQNAFNAERVKFIEPDLSHSKWVSFADSGLKNGVTRVFTEISTSDLNPNFPPRTGLARAGVKKLDDKDDGFNKRSRFSLTGIVTHDAGGIPAQESREFESLYLAAGSPPDTETDGEEMPLRSTSEIHSPASVDAAWNRIAKWCQDAIDRWQKGRASRADTRVLTWLATQNLLPNRMADDHHLADLVARYRNIEATIQFPRTVNSMDETQVAPLEYRLNVRGNVDDEGPFVSRRFLTVFNGKNRVAESRRSGRLELAEHLCSSDSPLTARVYVNRVWQWIFGRGIVASPNDFGRLGERPSHPELLDWVSNQFVRDGWSTKKLVRRLVLSKTFRQQNAVTDAARDKDPDNRLLHHFALRRMEAEVIRDSLLAVSGRLDSKLYGRPINPPRPAEDSAKRLFSGPLDGNGRRSIYLKMSIMEPPKFLLCFNLPDLKLPTGRRDVTNDPAQALTMLNHSLVVKMADEWAEQLIKDDSVDADERIRRMFLRAFGRYPDPIESARWTKAVDSFSSGQDLLTDHQAWAELAHAMFNVKEFIYYR